MTLPTGLTMKPDIDPRVKHIYLLIDPNTSEIRYVGKSVNPESRFKQHLKYTTGQSHRDRWIRKLIADGQEPIMEIVESIRGAHQWQLSEMWWIRRLRELGCPLTNATSGGEGVVNLSQESLERKRVNASEALRKLSFDQCVQIRQRIANGDIAADLACEHGVSQAVIDRVRRAEYPYSFPYKFDDNLQSKLTPPILTPPDVCRAIIEGFNQGQGVPSLVAKFGLCRNIVRSIVQGKYPPSNPYIGLPKPNRSCRQRKLDESQVIEIRKARAAGESIKSIANRMAVLENVVYGICIGRRYRKYGGPLSRKVTRCNTKPFPVRTRNAPPRNP